MKLASYLLKVIAFIYILSVSISCQASKKQLELYSDPDELEKEILQITPIGTLISEAERVMVQNGFGCQYINNTSYSKRRKPNGASIEAKTTSINHRIFCSVRGHGHF